MICMLPSFLSDAQNAAIFTFLVGISFLDFKNCTDRLYSQLSQLAKRSRIWALQLDLRHENEVRSFCEVLQFRVLTLGVIDTSDVPNASETGTSVTAQYVKLIS
jgi:hypothetical protein